jgi:two-component system, cell cycle response regulator DivK
MPQILIVEDDEDNREILSEFLTEEGYDVACASNAADAIALAVDLRPALILMDLQMPDSGDSRAVNDEAGLAAARVLRCHPTTIGIPIVALSGYSPTMVETSIKAAGFTAFASKPFDFSELANLLATLLESS